MKKILIVSDRPNVPVTAGNRSFINSLVNFLLSDGHEVHFLFIKEPISTETEDLSVMKDFWKDKLHVFRISLFSKIIRSIKIRYRWWFCNSYYRCDDYYPRGLHPFVNKLDEKYKFDACLVNYYYLSKLFCKINIPKKGLITHDYFAYKNLLVGGRHLYLNTTAHQEAIAMQRSPHIFALNEEEAVYFKKLSPHSCVHNIYSFYNYTPQPVCHNHNIVFLSGDNIFNQHGILWFISKIFPFIKEAYPDVKLIIGGKICNILQERSLPEGVCLKGFIADVFDFYSLGDIAINPVYEGTGLKIKTFESISFDKVTIVHPHSLVGIFDKQNAPIFASSNPLEWKNFICDIWQHEDKLIDVKLRNKVYLQKMNNEVKSQYNQFLLSD